MIRAHDVSILTLLVLIFGVRSQTLSPHYTDVLITHGMSASMSSTLYYIHDWTAGMAIDGDLRQNADKCACCASTNEGVGETFTVNLGKPYRISQIKIYGRNDSNNAPLNDLQVHLSNSETPNGNLPFTLSHADYEMVQVTESNDYQYVIVKSTTMKFVLICEIQVYNQECEDHFYDDCVKACGHCKDNAVCNKVTGICHGGCEPGYQKDHCTTLCTDGYYGDCLTRCGNCKTDTGCNKTNGHCSKGCKAGFEGFLCKTGCTNRTYGENCLNKCGHCKGQEICNTSTGHCTACKPGFTGENCKKECGNGRFGDDCSSTCGHCLNNVTCNITTGLCATGCASGFNGTYCNTSCPDGSYGPGCKKNCGSCKDNGVCNRFNGSCKLGCDAGFKGVDCNTECQHGTFGENCSSVCHCANNATCDKGNGTCSNGQCDFGYTGISCYTDLNIIVDYNITVNMSSTWKDWGPELAIDNNPGPNAGTCHCCSATQGEPNSWWEIDFGDVIPIMNIQIYGRQPNANQLKNAQIYLSNDTSLDLSDPFASIAIVSTNNCFNVTLPNTLLKVIRVVRPTGVLTLCEVKVYMGECKVGRFGGWCAEECNCYDNMTCEFTSGKCQTPACKDGWRGPACDRECSHTQFGPQCSNRCNCYDNASCNHVTGICDNDRCAPGWKGQTCSDECRHTHFGQNCSNTCHCYVNASCNHETGICENDLCAPGWKEPTCSDECSHAQFGHNCSNRCHCHGNASCNHVTGICDNDRCAPGWKGQTCSDVCNNNTFGENCTKACNCVNACDHINGICALGSKCVGGWQGDTCSERTPQDDDTGSNTGLIAGLVAGVVVIAILAGVIFVVIRRRKAGNLKEDKFGGIDSIPVKPRDIPKTAERRQKPAVKVENIDRSAPDGIDMADLNDVNAADDESTYYNINIINSGIKVHELWNYIQFMSLDNYKEFTKEYKSVPKTVNKSTNIAMLPRNRIKCRYKEMFPYDDNRAKLDTNGGKDGDFINASYIDGTEQRNKFIASQGPQKVMVDDFWRMVWEHKSPKIVMLTNVYENDSIKIVCYWSEEEDLIFGKLSIKFLTSVSTEDYDIRDMKITHENGESHLVNQYHYKSWPDKDVPSTAWSLVDFWRKVNETKPAKKAGPIVVHCSAGVGRTGTFIAMDCLCQEAVRYGTVKPLHTLQRLREQRISMVQTLAQYVYLHEAVAEALHFGTHFVTDYQFEHLYEYMMGKDRDSNKIRLEAQYELLIESLDQPLAVEKETPVENEYGNVQTTNLEINAYRPRSKNRNSRSIQELGAICLPTFGHGNGFILCKKPSEKLICGFWNLIDEENIKTIVMVADRNSKVKVPDDLGASSSALEGRPVVNCISEKTTPSTVERTFTLKPAGLANVQQSVNLFQYTAWKDGYVVPGDTTSVQSLLETVVQWHPLPSESQPILICCGDGVTKSGLLCVLMNEMYRMRKESGQINIIESVKHMKHRQRHIITGFAQYQYCHDVIREICLQTEHGTPPNDTSSDNEQLYQNL